MRIVEHGPTLYGGYCVWRGEDAWGRPRWYPGSYTPQGEPPGVPHVPMHEPRGRAEARY